MKKVLLLTVVMVLIAGIAYAQVPTVVGTAHDIRSKAPGATTEVCVFCHTPHGASTALPGIVMWNHATTAVNNYNLYTSATLKGTTAQPQGVSRACLSCHDGTVAVNQLQGGTLGTTQVFIGTGLIGTDLTGHHPVSVTYRNDLNPGLKAPINNGLPIGNTSLPLFGTATPLSLECGSCHAVHDNTTAQPFLRATNSNSQMCTACHNR